MSNQKPSVVAVVSGVVVGVAVFVGVNVTTGRAIVPTVESVSGVTISAPKYAPAKVAPSAGATGTYQTVCITCHQSEGQGIPGAFPPLAGSSWLNGDAETPVRIVLMGLSGAIEVKGLKFNAVMPPPPGLTDDKIAEAITYARTHFGNSSGAVDVATVKRVRDSLTGRTQPWSSVELSALRSAGGGGAEAAAGSAAPAPAPAAAAPAGTAPAEGAAKPAP